ncbi:MAG: sialidase family protein [Bacteroidales bacterium]
MKKLITFISFLFFVGLTMAQHQNVQLPYSGSSYAPEEPAIYVNPYNTDKLVAGANINNVYISNDGGFTWDANVLVSNQNGVWGDPVTIVDTAENYLFFHLAYPPAGNWIDRIVCQKSTDGGVTWNDGSYMGLNGNKAQDKQWAVIDRTNNTIYVTWTQFDDYGSSSSNDKSIILFSKSTDEGETWSPALKINEVELGIVSIVTIRLKELFLPLARTGKFMLPGPARKVVFDRSLDGGDTWLEEDIL